MSDSINITVNDQEIKHKLAALMRALASAKPAMQSIAQELATQTEFAFASEGPGWVQLKPATVNRRGSAHPILQVTNALARSITTQADAQSATVGTNLVYAAIHQLGGMAGRGHKSKIPARPYLPVESNGSIKEQLKANILVIIEQHLKRAVAK